MRLSNCEKLLAHTRDNWFETQQQIKKNIYIICICMKSMTSGYWMAPQLIILIIQNLHYLTVPSTGCDPQLGLCLVRNTKTTLDRTILCLFTAIYVCLLLFMSIYYYLCLFITIYYYLCLFITIYVCLLLFMSVYCSLCLFMSVYYYLCLFIAIYYCWYF